MTNKEYNWDFSDRIEGCYPLDSPVQQNTTKTSKTLVSKIIGIFNNMAEKRENKQRTKKMLRYYSGAD